MDVTIALETPSRFGTVSAQLRQFIDQTGGLRAQGILAGKAVTSFTSAANRHGGNEATLLSLNNVFYHWGAIIVPPASTDPLLYAAGGNPYGTSFAAADGEVPGPAALAAARYQGRRLSKAAAKLAADRDEQALPAATRA
jgi:NAD(P)H dehydrogenase (quinone)